MESSESDRARGFGNPPIGWELLDLYLTGEASATQSAEVESWLAAEEGNGRVLDALRDVRHAAESREKTVDVDALWGDFIRRREVGRRPPVIHLLPTKKDPRRARVAWTGWITVAAGVAALAVAVARIPRHWIDLVVSSSRTAQSYSTSAAQVAEIDLIDGTHVVLGPESRLTERAGYGEHRREVDVEGAAYFTVRHDTNRPFMIHTRDATTEDVGTEFAVRSYPEMLGSEVVVKSGRVEVRPTGDKPQSVRLDSGDEARLARDGTLAVEHGVDVTLALGWLRGEHQFTNVPFATVIPEVERVYGVTIRVASPDLLRHRLTVAFIDQTAREVVQTLGLALDATVVWNGKSATFHTTGHPRLTDPHFRRVMPDSLRYRRGKDSIVSVIDQRGALESGGQE